VTNYVGATVALTFTVAPDETPTVTVTAPDGTTTSPTATAQGAGAYEALVSVDQAGTWAWVVTTTNQVHPYAFEVEPATWAGIVSVADTKEHLGKSGSRITDDEELERFVLAASEWVESRVGPVVPRQVTRVVYPASGLLFLDGPVLSVDSITAAHGWAGIWNVADYYPDLETGVVHFGATAAGFTHPVTVTWTAGRTSVPPTVRWATLEVVQWLWDTQRGVGESRVLGQDDLEEAAGVPATVPYRVGQMLESHAMGPSVA
jgi:hypothetical protein